MEQSEGSSEQAECSKEPTECTEQTEIPSEQHASEQTERTEPMPVEHAACSSEQPECSKQPECSNEQTAPAEPAKGAEPFAEWSEPWLERFAEHLLRLQPLWRTTHSNSKQSQCKAKSARGFAYIRLMTALGFTEGGVNSRLTQAMAFCKEFFRLLKQKMRAVALEYLDESPDEALRFCPAWVRLADSYLNLMPFMFASLNSQRNEKRNAKKRPASRTAPQPPLAQTKPLTDAAGVQLMRRVVRGMRRVAKEHGGPTRDAAAAVARRLGDTEERVFALWCGMRKLSVFKLRALLFRGDAPSESGRLDALDWAIADLLIMYGITLVGEASYQNYEQLSALLGTFHLVQRFGLERPGRRVLSSKWSEAARWYSRNRVQMSALGLQKRWLELKVDTRRRMLSRLRQGARAPEPLPLHQAIARRYEHVVVAKSGPSSWKRLVSEGRVTRPTSERGPAPGEPDVSRTKGDDESSDSDTAAAAGDDDDDDDLTIIEKTLETIDLSEDQNDETDTNEVVKVPPDAPVPQSQISRSLPSLEAKSSGNTNVSRKNDKTIDVNKEIVDLDAPSPKSNVLEALQGLDVDNLETTILFESDEEDTTSIDVINVNRNNESHNSNRRESFDSEDGNLVIDCEDSNSACDVRNANHRTVWKEIEREMIPESFNQAPLPGWPASGYSKSDTIVVLTHESKDSVNDESADKYPMLSRLLQTQCVYDTFTTVRPKVYYNTKRYHVGKAQKQYVNASKVSVGKDVIPGPDRSQVSVSELVSAARVAECVVDLVSEVGGEADECSKGESGGQQDEEGVIDPKLLMYAVVALRRLEDEIPQILYVQSTSPRTHPSSRILDEPQILSGQSTPPLTHPSFDDEPEILSQQSPPSPNLCPRESPPPPKLPLSPPNATIPPQHAHSLFHYYAATLPPKFVFLKRNIPLLKQCKPCSVVLTRVDLGERAERVGMNRVAKKVELPDIEEVRRNNRSMLTAQVAPLAPRREGYISSPEPASCSSDSDWTPYAERSRLAEPHPALPDLTVPDLAVPHLALPDLAEPHSAELHSVESADEEAEPAGGSRRPGATSAELGQLLNDLLAEAGSNGECKHDNTTGVRGPLSSVFAESCASCALRVLSAPPISGVEARLQRRLLRRLAKAPNQPSTIADTTATSTTVTTTTVTTIGSTATVPTITIATERKEKSKKSKSKPRSQKRPRPPSPRPPPPRARSPEDPEAAAREWLRQKNIAAEKFGVKPRSFKKQAPAALPQEQPATLQPLATTSQVPANMQHLVTSQVPQLEPPAVLKAMQDTNQVPKLALNQQLPRMNNFQIMMREAIASALPPPDDQHSAQPFRTSGTINKSAQNPNSILLNQANSTPLLNQTNPVINKNCAQIPNLSPLNQKKAPHILNEINAPSLFNPNAIADINKKLVTLAPTTEAEAFGFHPVISNVHSLAPPKTPTFKKHDPVAKKDPKTQHIVIIPASNPTGATSILLRSQESEVAKSCENVFTSPQTSLPQVVNVTGGHLPSASVGQALHLIVSQSPQKTNAPMLSNILNQPNMIVSGNMIQNVQNQQVSVRPALPNYIVTSMPQLVQSQPLLVSCTSLATPTTASQPSVFSSMPNRTSQAAPMLVRSVQAGPAGLSQQNVLSVQNVSQQNSVSHHIVSQGNVASQRNVLVQNVSQQNSVSHLVSQGNVASLMNVSVQNVSQQNSVSHQIVSQGNVVTQQHAVSQQNPVSQQNAVLQQNVSQQNVSQHNVSQQNVSQQNPVSQQNTVSGHIPIQAGPAQGPNVAEKSDDAIKDSDPLPPLTGLMRASLNWSAPPIPSHVWARGRDSTSLCVLCTGPRDHPGWQLTQYLLVSEEELPASRAAYWTTRPRARLSLPGEEPFSPAKRRKVDPDASKSWLKVKAFARLAPEEVQVSQKDSQKDSQDLAAPGRVFVNNMVYQKLSDDPLVYAKLLVAVQDARACRALLARGAALQLYCLRTGKLFPLQAEPKEDVSRITLSGDEDVSGALVALAKRLYQLPDCSDPQSPVADTDKQTPMKEIRNTGEDTRDLLEPSESEPRPAKRPRETTPAEHRKPPNPQPLVTSPPCRPADVIELSDED